MNLRGIDFWVPAFERTWLANIWPSVRPSEEEVLPPDGDVFERWAHVSNLRT